jgi:hypothetical protein
MHLHIDENPLNPLPTSVKVGSTYNITLNIQNICDKSQNNVMSNVTVTLMSRAGHSRVDIPTRVIPVLTPGAKALTWKLSGESSGLEVLEFIAIATNAHNNITLFDTLIHDLEVIPSSTTFYDTTFFITDIEEIPIADALVRIGSIEIITDVNGIATMSLPQGNYSYFVTKFSFKTFNSSITLKDDLFLNLKLTRIMGEEIGTENLPYTFLGSPWFVAFLAVGLGVSGIGLGSLCIHGGNSMRSRFFIVSTIAILTILITITIYVFGIRIPSPLISILGSTHSLIHWIGWIGTFYLLFFMALSVVSKRKAIKLYPKIFRAHVIGNLLAAEYVTVHFMQQITRPAENYPILGTGVILYISVIGLALSGYGSAFRFFRSETKKARFLHTSLAVTLLLVVIWHIIHGISNPFMA